MKAIRHFGIVVSNAEKSLHFYGDLLGLKMQRDIIEEGPFVEGLLGLKNVKVRTMKMAADDGNLIELLYYIILLLKKLRLEFIATLLEYYFMMFEKL